MRAAAWKAVQRARLLAAIAGRYGRGREVAVVFGNCQADALRQLLERSPAFAARYATLAYADVDPDSGSVTLCGARNPSFSSRAAVHLRRHKLSYLFQNYGLVDTDTVEANMKLATRFGKAKGKAEKERIADALAQVGLSGYERRKVYTLSGGEQQRVALAKIIAKSPDIILADEPTGSLDERNRSYVMDILKELNRQGKTIVVVTHDPYVSDCATRHIAL